MSRKMLRNVEKRGVQAARNGPSLPPTPAGGPVAKAEMSTADRLGSREVVTRSCGCTCYDWSYDQDVTQCATTGTPPRRAARAIRRCEALGTTQSHPIRVAGSLARGPDDCQRHGGRWPGWMA